MTETNVDIRSLLPPQALLNRPMRPPLPSGECCVVTVFVPEGAAVWHLPEDPSLRARDLIHFFEEILAGIGYVPLGYLVTGAVREQLKEDGADDLAEHVLTKRLVEVLRSLLRKHNRPASLDACHDELVRAAAAKVRAEPESPKR